MSRVRRAVAQTRNVGLDVIYVGTPLRDLRGVVTTSDTVFAPHSCDYDLIRTVFTRYPLHPSDVFVDIGCGYGRVMMMAARAQPNARVIGLEGEPSFAARAQHIRRRYPRVEIIQGWAPEAIPAETTYAFMFNPFPGAIAIEVLERLDAVSNNHDCRVIMLDPTDADLIIDSPIARNRFSVEHDAIVGSGLLKGVTKNLIVFTHIGATSASDGFLAQESEND